MAGWHHQLDGLEFEQIPGVGDGQGGLACCNSWSCKELGMTEWLNWTELTDVKIPSRLWLFLALFITEDLTTGSWELAKMFINVEKKNTSFRAWTAQRHDMVNRHFSGIEKVKESESEVPQSVVSNSVTPRTVAYHVPPSMGFSRQEYWSGLPFPSPGDLPNPGIEPGSPTL